MDQIHLKIADLQITIESDQLPIHQEDDIAYQAFTDSEKKVEVASDIEVVLEVTEPPNICRWEKIFDDDQSWTIFRKGEEYTMCFSPMARGNESLWVAQFPKVCNSVNIKCNEGLVLLNNGEQDLYNPFRYPLDQQLIVYHLAHKFGILIHAAGFMHSGKGLIFPGRSGAGKSTISRHLSAYEGWNGLSDDRILLREIDSEVYCFGTPWPGEEGIAKNLSERLSGIFFLKHGYENQISELTPVEAVRRLMPVVSIPWYDEELVTMMLPVCESIISKTPTFELCFRPTEDIGEFLGEFLITETVT
jgi:hypothetical protein